MRRPLTAELMRERTSRLFDRILAACGPENPPEEVTWEVVYCDRCGYTHNMILDGGPPEGWTTEGDFERGFNDLCRDCSP